MPCLWKGREGKSRKARIEIRYAMEWIALTTDEQLEEIKNQSNLPNLSGVAIFKHSTRCSISSMMKNRLERSWDFPQKNLPMYYLDIIAFRSFSNTLASYFTVVHQSPQLLLTKNGEFIHISSHTPIT